MNKTKLNTIAAAVLLLGATAPLPAMADADREAMERAREQVELAREELRKATRELARSMARVEKDNPRAKYFEFMTNPDRPMIGIIIGDPKEKGDDRGVRVLAITPGGGAEKGGLEAGDIIIALDGKSLAATRNERPEDLMREHMHRLKSGDELKVEYLRDGKKGTTTVKTQSPEPDFAMSMIPPLPPDVLLGMKDEDFEAFIPPFAKMFSYKSSATRGLELSKLDEDLAGYFKTSDGVLVVKAPKDGTLGLKSGDVIQKIDGAKVSEPLTVMDKLRSRADERSVEIEIVRNGKKQTLRSTIPVADASRLMDRHGNLEIIIDGDHHHHDKYCPDDKHD